MVNATLMEFIIVKGKGKSLKAANFQTLDDGIKAKISTACSKARFLVRFDVESKNWNGKWFTNLTAIELEDWAVGADAALREAKRKAIQENIAKKTQESSMNKDLGLFNGVSEFE